ncbi:MAG: zinc ABC transporter substrate-binding protein [Candidatus Delongbacteria bacterium]|nr:zinc ABC transporter substrate-binding protein [Candidatus Delongbacteria bacterium]
MKKLLFTAFVLTLMFSGCTGKSGDSKPVLSVSILPQKYFTERITGDKFEINVLLPPGVSPHTFEPAPSILAKLAGSEAYLIIGEVEFEKAWMDKFISVKKDLKVFNTTVGADYIELDEDGDDQHQNHAHEEDAHEHKGVDPHIWMSVSEVKIIAQNTFRFISETDPANEQFYKDNLEDFLKDLDKLDMQIKTILSGLKNRKFIIYHPALGYFARDYDLEEIPVEIDGKEPSPSQIKKVIDTARENGIKTVFIQKQFDSRMAKSIAEEIGGKVLQLDPLSEEWLNNMIIIARTLQFEEK